MLKTPVTVLQELGIKAHSMPEYECLGQFGPPHLATFEYQCTMCGKSVTASAHSKKEAKQEAARKLLALLFPNGAAVPVTPAHAHAPSAPAAEAPHTNAPDSRTYVALVQELCAEYLLPVAEYTLIGDTGPPHMRCFTVRCAVGEHSRSATAGTKKAARQLASEHLYKYLRNSLRFTRDFVEDDALMRVRAKKMDRFEETRDLPWRPDLSLKVSEYELALVQKIDESLRERALVALRETAEAKQSARVQLDCAVSVLGLNAIWNEYPTCGENTLKAVELLQTYPSLIFIREDEEAAAAEMVEYLRMALSMPAQKPAM